MESIRGMADGLSELAMGFGGLLCFGGRVVDGRRPTSAPYVGGLGGQRTPYFAMEGRWEQRWRWR